MPSGGSRPNTGGRRSGQGRPKAATTVATRALADDLAADGKPLPLEIIVGRMRDLWASNDDEAKREACQLAAQAAPYIHPRLAPRPAQKINLDLPPLGLRRTCLA